MIKVKGKKVYLNDTLFCQIHGCRYHHTKFGPQSSIRIVLADGTIRGPYPYFRDAVQAARNLAQEAA